MRRTLRRSVLSSQLLRTSAPSCTSTGPCGRRGSPDANWIGRNGQFRPGADTTTGSSSVNLDPRNGRPNSGPQCRERQAVVHEGEGVEQRHRPDGELLHIVQAAERTAVAELGEREGPGEEEGDAGPGGAAENDPGLQPVVLEERSVDRVALDEAPGRGEQYGEVDVEAIEQDHPEVEEPGATEPAQEGLTEAGEPPEQPTPPGIHSS